MAWRRSQNEASGELFNVAFLQTNDLTRDELEELEDEGNEEFDCNPNTLSVKPPKRVKVKLRIIETWEKVEVICRLPVTYTWLRATIKLNYVPDNDDYLKLIKYGLFQVKQYYLDPTRGPNQLFTYIKNIIVMDNEDEDYLLDQRTDFLMFLEDQPIEECYLENLVNLINKFETINP